MKNIYKYGREVNSHDLLKTLAITTMVVDHVGRFFLNNDIWFRSVGRMAAPQFFFLVGYSGSYRFKREILLYGVALWVINFLTSPGTSIVEHILPINILISFVLIKAILNKFNVLNIPSEFLVLLFGILMSLSLPTYMLIEYGTIGLSYAIGGRLLSKGHPLARFWIAATVAVHFCFESVFLILGQHGVPMLLLPGVVALVAVVFVVNLMIFLRYRFRIFPIRQEYLKTLAIYISRYSLELYFFHLSAFMIVNYVWHPAV